MPQYWKYRMNHNFYPALHEFRKHCTVYLEIGLLEGRTAEWMLKNILIQPGSKLIGIDPVVEPLADLVKNYHNKVQVIQGLSQSVIPARVKSGRWKAESIDIIYIDGDNSPDAIKNDFEMCWYLLKINGVLIFDDYLIRDKNTGKSNVGIRDMIDSIINEYSDRLIVIFTNRQLGIRKIAA